MAIWNKTCNDFKNVRYAILDAMEEESVESCIKVMHEMCKCCDELTPNDDMYWEFYDEFRDLKWEIHEASEYMYGEDYKTCLDVINVYLDEMYDLCDVARVWLAV